MKHFSACREGRYNGHCRSRGFSLIEVVLALGVASFALIAVVALLPVGIQSTKDSLEESGAVNVISQVVADRRASPLTAQSMLYQLPILNTAMSATSQSFLVTDYDQLTSTASQAQYRVDYRIVPPVTGSLDSYQMWLRVSWPAASAGAVSFVETLVTFPQP
jgi:uncharacterized protein (TIGR02598 family)